MENNNLYHKGIVLWVEDNFIEKPIEKEDDVWERIFGNQLDKVYRFMDLSLIIATNLKDASRIILELEEDRKKGTYIFCIIDVFIPKRPGEKITFPDGISIAKKCLEKSIDFVFLSTAKDINKLLIEKGIKFAPFYQKQIGDCIIPDTLVNYILQHLKSNINWIDLRDIYINLHSESKFLNIDPNNKEINGLANNYYPFFGPFTDFVDRWENIIDLKKDSKIITRCATHNSDEFIQQSILVAINTLVQRFPQKVLFRYTNDFDRYKDYNNKNYNTIPTIIVDVIRVDIKDVSSTSIESEFNKKHSFQEMLQNIPETNRIVFFVLPNDDSSDSYLEIAKKKINLKYEDIPEIRIGDKLSRENLVRNSLNLVVKNVRINQNDSLGEVFLIYPEILLNPISWTILLESLHIAETLSDSYEIVEAIAGGLNNLILNADDKTKERLIKGLPIESSQLLKIGTDQLKEKFAEEFDKYYYEKWGPKSLKNWLLRSWHSPYSIDIKSLYSCGNIEEGMWENHSFSVLLDLIENYKVQKSETLLNDIKNFLQHPTIRKVIDNPSEELISQDQWTSLLSERWPYDTYPIPISLSKKLKKFGRFMWFESDNLTFSQVFPSTRYLYKSLNNSINHTAALIDHIESVLNYLPEEHSYYIGKFIHLIKNENIAKLWDSPEKRNEIYKDLLDFFNNILPLTYISYAIYNGKLSDSRDLDEVKKRLSSFTYGKIIGPISGMRKDSLFKMISPIDNSFIEGSFDSLNVIIKALQINKAFSLSYKMDELIVEYNKNWKKIYDSLDDIKKQELEKILGTDRIGQISNDLRVKLGIDNKLEELYKFFTTIPYISSNHDCIAPDHLDIWGISLNYIQEIQSLLLNHNTIDHSVLIQKLNDLNANLKSLSIDEYQKADFKEKTKNLIQTGEYFDFLGTPFDVTMIAFTIIERLKNLLNNLFYLDGYHCLDIIIQMRNICKEITPKLEEYSVDSISMLFESFCYGCEAYFAHIRFLLEQLNENELADKITLKYINKIVLPIDSPLLSQEILQEFIKVNKAKNNFRLYHLGIPGEGSKGKLMIRLKGANISMEK